MAAAASGTPLPAIPSAGSHSLARPLYIVLALTVVGAAFRFATLDVQSLNVDEADTFLLLHRSFQGMLTHIVDTESSPPLYYALGWLWTQMFGLTTFGLRSFSALVGTATIPVMYLAGRETSVRVGLWAAALTTFSSAMFFLSQQARCYPLLVLFLAAAYIYWRRSMRDGEPRSLLIWGLLMSLAVLTHYFAALVFLPQVVLLYRRVGLRRVALPAGLVCVVGLALAPLAIAERTDGKTNWIAELSLGGRMAEAAKVLTVGKYTLLVGPALAVVLGLCAGAVWLVAKRGEDAERSAARDALIVIAVALGVPLLLAVTHIVDIFDGLNMLPSWVPITLLVAYGVGARRSGLPGAAIGATLCIIGSALILTTNLLPIYQRDDWRGAAAALGQPSSPRAIVLHSRFIDGLKWYLGDLKTDGGSTVRASEVDFVTLRTRRTVGAPLPPVTVTSKIPGYSLVRVDRQPTFAISAYRAPAGSTVNRSALQAAIHEPTAEVIIQR